MLESPAYKAAIKTLTQSFLERYRSEDREMATKVVEQALSEYMAPFCLTCKGAGETVVNDLKVVCVTCSGSRLRRYSDVERAGLMKLSLQRVRGLARKMQWVADQVGTLDRAVNLVMSAELERWR